MEPGTGQTEGRHLLRRMAGALARIAPRRVWRTALTYGAVAFVLLQLGEILLPAFGAPDGALRGLVVATLLGFPVALCMAWALQVRPRKEAGNLPARGPLPPRLCTVPPLAFLAVFLTAMGGLGWWTARDDGTGAGAPFPEGGDRPAGSFRSGTLSLASLAVLPLRDFDQDTRGESFAQGLHQEVVTELGGLPALRILSRTSVARYDPTGKTMPEVADELGVDGVLEGAVFRSGDQVRISVQLIHGPSDTLLWAESYEGEMKDVFSLQREVARRIRGGLEAFLKAP